MIPLIIPARKGSKSIPNKNMARVAGKPLLQWALEAAKKAKLVDNIFISTDSDEYADFAAAYGAYYLPRPLPLAEDVPTEDVLLYCLEQLRSLITGQKIDTVVLQQCTTPFITGEDIDSCITLHSHRTEFSTVITATKVREHPRWMFSPVEVDGVKKLRPWHGGSWPDAPEGVRQNLPAVFRPNGGVYVVDVKRFEDEKTILIPPLGFVEVPYWRGFDIDEPVDLTIADALRIGTQSLEKIVTA